MKRDHQEADAMAGNYTHKQLTDVKDSAAEFGIGEIQAVRFGYADLDCEDTGFSHHHLKPGKRTPFGHKHENAEEVYVVIAGSGRAKLDDDIVEVERLDAVRVAPGVIRAFEAGDEGLEVLAFGPRHEGDGEIIQDWWTEG